MRIKNFKLTNGIILSLAFLVEIIMLITGMLLIGTGLQDYTYTSTCSNGFTCGCVLLSLLLAVYAPALRLFTEKGLYPCLSHLLSICNLFILYGYAALIGSLTKQESNEVLQSAYATLLGIGLSLVTLTVVSKLQGLANRLYGEPIEY